MVFVRMFDALRKTSSELCGHETLCIEWFLAYDSACSTGSCGCASALLDDLLGAQCILLFLYERLMTDAVQQILSSYSHENPGVKTNLARLLNHGQLGGTGKMVILPVDQGWEHGPMRSFQPNPASHDPEYHFRLAVESGVSAYAAPLGFLQAHAAEYAGDIPLILKLSNSESLMHTADPVQSITATIEDALQLGCVAIGFTLYVGSSENPPMYEYARELIAAAREAGLVAIAWSYPRGSSISKDGETAIDVVSYAAHIACQLGAHIVKVKPPTAHIETEHGTKVITQTGLAVKSLKDRIAYVRQACFAGKRIVIFSGGEATDDQSVLEEITQIAEGGGYGSIIGRNAFKRPFAEGVQLLQNVMDVYKQHGRIS